jgi:hypothetical protein
MPGGHRYQSINSITLTYNSFYPPSGSSKPTLIVTTSGVPGRGRRPNPSSSPTPRRSSLGVDSFTPPYGTGSTATRGLAAHRHVHPGRPELVRARRQHRRVPRVHRAQPRQLRRTDEGDVDRRRLRHGRGHPAGAVGSDRLVGRLHGRRWKREPARRCRGSRRPGTDPRHRLHRMRLRGGQRFRRGLRRQSDNDGWVRSVDRWCPRRERLACGLGRVRFPPAAGGPIWPTKSSATATPSTRSPPPTVSSRCAPTGPLSWTTADGPTPAAKTASPSATPVLNRPT